MSYHNRRRRGLGVVFCRGVVGSACRAAGQIIIGGKPLLVVVGSGGFQEGVAYVNRVGGYAKAVRIRSEGAAHLEGGNGRVEHRPELAMRCGIRRWCEWGVLDDGNRGRIAEERPGGGKVPKKGKLEAAGSEESDGLSPSRVITRNEVDAAEFAVIPACGGAYDEVCGRVQGIAVADEIKLGGAPRTLWSGGSGRGGPLGAGRCGRRRSRISGDGSHEESVDDWGNSGVGIRVGP